MVALFECRVSKLKNNILYIYYLGDNIANNFFLAMAVACNYRKPILMSTWLWNIATEAISQIT